MKTFYKIFTSILLSMAVWGGIRSTLDVLFVEKSTMPLIGVFFFSIVAYQKLSERE